MRLFILVLALQVSALSAIEIGDKAPELTDITWLKNGAPSADRDWTVVELWATWCPPCIESIPDLTRIHKEYDRVSIIGISEEDTATLTPFIERMGDGMDYYIGSAGPSFMPTWTQNFETIGLPFAFLVSPEGQVAWYGNTANLEPAIKQAINGTLDIEKNKKLCPLELDFIQAMQTRQLETIDNITRQILAIDPAHSQALFIAGAVAQQLGDPQRFRNLVDRLDPGLLDPALAGNIGSWLFGQEQFVYRNLDLAFPLAKRALTEQPNDPLALATMARGYYLIGRLDRAIELQQQAVTASGTGASGYQPALNYYQTALALTEKDTGTLVEP